MIPHHAVFTAMSFDPLLLLDYGTFLKQPMKSLRVDNPGNPFDKSAPPT